MDYAGASPDGKVIFKGQEMGFEAKCTVSWDGYYSRRGVIVDESHNDFWQLIAEMHALKVNKLLYATAMPLTTEQYEYIVIEKSHVHTNAMLHRLKIANEAVNIFLTEKCLISEALTKSCLNYKF
jgi:hypothetical protein